MTTTQAKDFSIRLLRRPRYYAHANAADMQLDIYCALGAHMEHFNVLDGDWYPVRTEEVREHICERGVAIPPREAERLMRIMRPGCRMRFDHPV